MGLFIPSRRARPRQFSYEPRYYNPEKDESIKRRMRIQGRTRRRRSPATLIYFAALLIMALYLYFVLRG